jgi:hypothetical protein
MRRLMSVLGVVMAIGIGAARAETTFSVTPDQLIRAINADEMARESISLMYTQGTPNMKARSFSDLASVSMPPPGLIFNLIASQR